MSKVETLLKLVEDLSPNVPNSAVSDDQAKQYQKDGIRVQKAGNTTTLVNTKTNKKVIIRDDGHQVVAKKVQNGKPNGPDDKVRGTADDIQREVDWMKSK